MYYLPKIVKRIIGYPSIKKTIMEEHTKVDSFSVVVASEIGKCSYIGEHSSVLHTKIGKYCSISNYCTIGGGGHPINWVSTSPVFNTGGSILHFRYTDLEYEPFCITIIGNDVWIGANSMIKGGITIGDGAVIGMGAVVTKNVGPYEIWAGNPARCIKKRFDDATITELCKTKWWDFSEEKIRNKSKYFGVVDEFFKNI